MKYLISSMTLVFLISCGTKIQTKITPGGGTNPVEPLINGKKASVFYKQFYYDKRPNKECQVMHYFLQMEDKIQAVTDPSLFFDVELFLSESQGKNYHM